MKSTAILGAVAIGAPLASALPESLQAVLSEGATNPLYKYPTDLTQGIMPKAFHSHNDYWRPLPFWSALSQGAISVEADVWLYNSVLHVGHEESALTAERTFDVLYVQPILDVLQKQNPDSEFVSAGPTKNGVYDTASGQTLYLFVDLKTDGEETWPYVVEALEPLRSAGYLTTINGSAIQSGPVTVIGTGNTPLDLVQSVEPRDYFWDGPLATLGSTFSNITKEVSPIASTNFETSFGKVLSQEFNSNQLSTLQDQVKAAHDKGIFVRYWGAPGWPIGTRNFIWRTLWDAGVDLLNVDDLEAAAGFWETLG